jgi:hypothetical protein
LQVVIRNGRWIDPRPYHYMSDSDIEVIQAWVPNYEPGKRIDFLSKLEAALITKCRIPPKDCEPMTMPQIIAVLKNETPVARPARGNNLPPARHLPSGGMPWQDAKDKAERHVKRNGYPGLKALAKIVECSPATMSKAIERSPHLKARKAEYEAERTGKPRETPMTDVVLDNTQQTTEADPLGRLVAEQRADDDDPSPLSNDPPRQSPSRRRSQ